MREAETNLQKARRHVVEAEQRIARQKALLEGLVRGGHTGRVIAQAEETLHVMEQNLWVLRQHMEIELQHTLSTRRGLN